MRIPKNRAFSRGERPGAAEILLNLKRGESSHDSSYNAFGPGGAAVPDRSHGTRPFALRGFCAIMELYVSVVPASR